MALADALDPHNLLCYEMNGEPLPQSHGFPLLLIAPGWYGIANTNWPQSIQALPTRDQNRFMARDYVTIREQVVEGQSVWTETSVGRVLLKSAPAKVTRSGGHYQIVGAAWRAPIARCRSGSTVEAGSLPPSTRARPPSSPKSSGRWSGATRPGRAWESNGQITRPVAIA